MFYHHDVPHKVSVIIPVFNSEEWLWECIDSVRCQTQKELEIICINDGSTDRSGDIITECAEKDKRVVSIEQENRGLSEARNAGIEAATGKYILFVDSDDMLIEDAVEKLYSKMENNSLEMVSFNAESFSNSKEFEKRAQWENETYFGRNLDEDVECTGVELLAYLTENSMYVASACSVMLLRNFVLEKGIRFIPGILHEDEAFIFEAYVKAEKAGCVNRYLYKRRCREGSIMTQAISFKNPYGIYKACKQIECIIKSSDISEKYIDSVCSHLSRLQRAAAIKYMGCSTEEKERIKQLPLTERVELETFLIYPAGLETRIKKLNNEMTKLKKERTDTDCSKEKPKIGLLKKILK